MPDHKEMGREPTDRERETAFAPHKSPARQGDGDPGTKRPRLDPAGDEPAEDESLPDDENAPGKTAGARGQWSSRH